MSDHEDDDEKELPKIIPIIVEYCMKCGLPKEYCEYGPSPVECLAERTDGLSVDAKKESVSAVSNVKAAAKKNMILGTVILSKNNRTKKKCITVISGLEDFDIKLKDLAKIFSKKYACSSSVVEGTVPNTEEINIQGDCVDDVAEYIADKLKVPKGRIFFVEKNNKSRMFPDAAEDDEANEETLIDDAQQVIDSL